MRFKYIGNEITQPVENIPGFSYPFTLSIVQYDNETLTPKPPVVIDASLYQFELIQPVVLNNILEPYLAGNPLVTYELKINNNLYPKEYVLNVSFSPWGPTKWIEPESSSFENWDFINASQLSSDLIPHIPLTKGTNFPAIKSNIVVYDPNNTTLGVDKIKQYDRSGDLIASWDGVDHTAKKPIYAYDLSKFETTTESYKLTLDNIDSQLEATPLCYYDSCPSPFYLIWKDRSNNTQCYGFRGKVSSSIKYNNINYTDYRGKRHGLSSQSTLNWDLNTGWIDEKDYKGLESIYASGDIKLYDLDNNILYDVIVKNGQDYDIRDPRNNRWDGSLNNFKIKLESAKITRTRCN